MIRIYHTSDLHDHRGIAAPLRALRNEAPGILIDCGDALRGSQTVYRRREPITAEIAEAGYDVQAMGNREFHYIFGAVRARVARMRYPLVCSNLVDTFARPLPFLTTFGLDVQDGTIVRKLRFCALLVPQYASGSGWERIFGWRFLDPYVVAEHFVTSLAADETPIVLSHLGLRADRVLAQRVPHIALVLGGHSHDTLHAPEMVGSVPLVHAGPYGAFVSRTELAFTTGHAEIAAFDLVPLLT